MTTRNRAVVAPHVQERLRTARVLIAGCGSTGGAAVEPLVRLGVQDFVLADPGRFELDNLNRQIAGYDDIGRNKAVVAADRIRQVNPYANVEVNPYGVTPSNAGALLDLADVVIDGVDVTTSAGWLAKYALHAAAAKRGKPVLTGWDMAGTQYVRYYAYGRPRCNRPFAGAVDAGRVASESPWQLMARVVPIRLVPEEMLREAIAHLDCPEYSVSQVVYTSELFGAIVARATVVILGGGHPRAATAIDLHRALATPPERVRRSLALLRARSAALPVVLRLRRGSARVDIIPDLTDYQSVELLAPPSTDPPEGTQRDPELHS